MTQAAGSSVLKVARQRRSAGRPADQPGLDPRGHAARARLRWAESPDGTTSHWTWDCTAGRFRWYYEVDESIVIVAGSVSIQVDDEEPVVLAVGDAAYFPAGHWVTWQVDEYVRKQAVVRVPVPRTMQYAVNGHRPPQAPAALTSPAGTGIDPRQSDLGWPRHGQLSANAPDRRIGARSSCCSSRTAWSRSSRGE